MSSSGARRGSGSSQSLRDNTAGQASSADGPVSMANLRKEFWRDTANRPNGPLTRAPSNTKSRPAPLLAGGAQQEEERQKNQAFLKQLSTLSSISQEEDFPLGHNGNSAADGGREQPQRRRGAQPLPPPPGPPPAPAMEAPGPKAKRRVGGVGQLSSAGVEVYVGQLKTLLKEAKEELKKRHRIIDVQKKRLDKAEEGRSRARTLFEELIEKVRVEVEQQEMLQIQLNESQGTIEDLQRKVAELEWERQRDGMDSNTMREIMAERAVLQESLAKMREEMDRKEQESSSRLEEAERRLASSEQHGCELGLKLQTLTSSLEEAQQQRERDAEEIRRLRDELDKATKEVTEVAAQINNEREVFLKRLQAGIVVLKHSKQSSKPKPRVLSVDEKGEVLMCREQGSDAKDGQMPLAGVQVVVGKISKVLAKSGAHKDLCLSIISGASPAGGMTTIRGSIDESMSPATATPTSNATPPGGSQSNRRSGFFSLTGGRNKAETELDREALDLELTADSRMGRDELVAGLRLLGAGTGPMDAAEMMRRTSFSGSVTGSLAGTFRDA